MMDHGNLRTRQRRRILGCASRKWVFTIGWAQTVGTMLSVLIVLLTLTVFRQEMKEAKLERIKAQGVEKQLLNDEASGILKTLYIVLLVFTFLVLVVQFFSGIILIQGAKQKNPKKLKLWTVAQAIFVLYAMTRAVVSAAGGDNTGLVTSLAAILLTFFCIWAVDLHRKELLDDDESIYRSGIDAEMFGIVVPAMSG